MAREMLLSGGCGQVLKEREAVPVPAPFCRGMVIKKRERTAPLFEKERIFR